MNHAKYDTSLFSESDFDNLISLTKEEKDRYLNIFKMPFIRPKKIVFCNNKGGVGKTTLLFNIASEAHRQGLRVAMVDLDPQTNLTMNVLGENRFTQDIYNNEIKTIYDVLKGLETGISDVNFDVKPYEVDTNGMFLVPGSLNLSGFEERVLNTAFTETAQGGERGFRIVSAINRYLDKIAVDYKIDLFFIDTSPNLGPLNKAIILTTDFFIVPVNPDIFSVQGVENIASTYSKWKEDWRNGQEYVGKGLPAELRLKNSPIFLGWLLNDYRPYAEQPAQKNKDYILKLKNAIKDTLSASFTKNGLFLTTQEPIGQIQEFGTLLQKTHEAVTPVTYIKRETIQAIGSRETYDHVKQQLEETTKTIIDLAVKYQNA